MSAVDLNAYAEAVFRPLICREAYLAGLADLKERVTNAAKIPFDAQLGLITELFEFIERWYPDGINSHAIMKPHYHNLKATHHAEIAAIEAKLPPIPEPLRGDFRPLRQLLDKTRIDIMSDDLKTLVQGVFRVVHKFPRTERGGMLRQLPWAANSWYLFDFCAAVFMSDDAIDAAKELGGLAMASYDFDGDMEKARLLQQHHRALLNFVPTVKIALFDLLRTDLPQLATFFRELLRRRTTAEETDSLKLGELPILKPLLWYAKQLMNTQRLLLLLPAVPGNSKRVTLPLAPGESHVSNDDQVVDVERYMAAYHAYTPALLKPVLLATLSAPGGPRTVKDFREAGLLGKAIDVPYGITYRVRPRHTADLLSGSRVGQQRSPAERLAATMATDYFDIRTLKGRLGLMRKFQLVGEIFTPRNWGADLNHMRFVDPRRIAALRDAMTHIEDGGYFDQVMLLEADQPQLARLFRELQTLKEHLYEQTAERVSHFVPYPDGYESGFLADDRALLAGVWGSIQAHYADHVEIPVPPFCHSDPLLDEGEIRAVLSAVKPDSIGLAVRVLKSKEPFEAERQLADLIDESKDKAVKKAARKQIKKAFKAYKSFRTASRQAMEKARSEAKSKRDDERGAARELAMTTHFPTINAQADVFWAVQNDPNPPRPKTIEYLQNRFVLLEQLLDESHIFDSSKVWGVEETQKRILEAIEQDMALSMAMTYVVAQILTLFKKLSVEADLSAVSGFLGAHFQRYLALRNHLLHTDPILEGVDLPYYEMSSDAPRMLAIMTGELMFHVAPEVAAVDEASLPPPAAPLVFAPPMGGAGGGAPQRPQQNTALASEDFVFGVG